MSPKEHLSVWLMKTFLSASIATPGEYDEPTVVADNLMVALPGVGIKVSFNAQKLVSGCGVACATVLDALVRLALKKQKIAPHEFRATAGFDRAGNEETKDQDEDEAVVDELGEGSEVGAGDDGIDQTPKLVDPLELHHEAERVAASLQIRIPATKGDWRTHVQMMGAHHRKMSELMKQLAPILNKVATDSGRAVEMIQNREKSLNDKFQPAVSDYAARAGRLAGLETDHAAAVTEANKMQAELDDIVLKLNQTKEQLTERQSAVSDTTPLINIRKAIAGLKEEVRGLEIQSAILLRALTQTWMQERGHMKGE
jgi:estrogen-related receptor beta like 1